MKRPLPLLACAGLLACNPAKPPSPPLREGIPIAATIVAPGLGAPVEVVRDEWGIPHIYARTLPDAAWAQGYVTAEDRFVQMDLIRRNAEGTLGELLGELESSVLHSDLEMRTHHLRAVAQAAYDLHRQSADPEDQLVATTLDRYADGVNAVVERLRRGDLRLPGPLALLYDPTTARTWTAVDCLLLLELQLFYFGYNGAAEIQNTLIAEAARRVFEQSQEPGRLARKGLGADLRRFAPLDQTSTIDQWNGLQGETSTARLRRRGKSSRHDEGHLAELLAANPNRKQVASNNWVIGPQLSASGHVLVANDTHVPLWNPPVWHLVHLIVQGEAPLNTLGVTFPGVPGVALGMNEHVAWGATTNQLDLADVYAEKIVPCDGGRCVEFRGRKVPLVPRKEAFAVGKYGRISRTIEITYYDVPHHGPILPTITGPGTVRPLGERELSVRYTGHQASRFARAAIGLASARTVGELVKGLDRDNHHAAFNWVMGDDQGNYGWTQIARVPRRAKGHAPWTILPGDGSAEWGPDLSPRHIPHAYNPAKGFLVTANNDPNGSSFSNDPFFDEPEVDGAPLYVGWDYGDGGRVGQITRRIQSIAATRKLTLDDMGALQGDATSFYGRLLTPTYLEAAQALVDEAQSPGRSPELAPLLAAAKPEVKSLLPRALAVVGAWKSFDTPSATADENPSPQVIADSQAATLVEPWTRRLLHGALDDELEALGRGVGGDELLRLLVTMCLAPKQLRTGLSPATGEALLFDDLRTKAVEGRRFIAAQALLATLDFLVGRLGPDLDTWRWGRLHTLTIPFYLPAPGLQLPPAGDPRYGRGFPRHGTDSCPDNAGFSLGGNSFSYGHGPGLRFVAEMTPDGPRARNVLAGGQVFDPASPHYRDQLDLWLQNRAFDLAFTEAAVAASGKRELERNSIGRLRFNPAP